MDKANPSGNLLAETTSLSHASRLRRMRQLSKLLDGAIAIPGTNQRIGLDPIIGLIPGGGDTVSAALSAYIIIEAARMGLPRPALMQMVGNLLVDTFAGSVPVVGDIFDVVSKANLRNMQIVENHFNVPESRVKKVDRGFIILLTIGLIGFVLAIGGITVLIWSLVANLLK